MAKITPKLKEEILKMYAKKLCNVSAVCSGASISRKTFYDILKKDAEFREGIEEAKEAILDTAETMLQKKIMEGDTTSLIFFLKTRAKDRGYTERIEHKVDEDAGIDVIISRR